MTKYVTRQRKPVNNTLHLVLTFATCGAWLPVWVWLVVWVAIGPKDRVTTRVRDDVNPPRFH